MKFLKEMYELRLRDKRSRTGYHKQKVQEVNRRVLLRHLRDSEGIYHRLKAAVLLLVTIETKRRAHLKLLHYINFLRLTRIYTLNFCRCIRSTWAEFTVTGSRLIIKSR